MPADYVIRPIGHVESPLVDRAAAPKQGVFSTRSQDRPNPIGLHRVRIAAIDGNRLQVLDLEAFDRGPRSWTSSR